MNDLPSDAPSPKDRRGPARRRVLLGGKVVYGTGDFSADCTIRDLTDDGARVRVAGDLPTPDRFWLIVLGSGQAHDAMVAWRSESEIGLRFLSSADLSAQAPGPMRHLQALWLNSTLR